MRFLKFRVIALFLLPALWSCHRNVRVLKSPPGYNFSIAKPEKLDMKMREISGLAWDAKNNQFIAVNDEEGSLYMLDRDTKQLIGKPVSFGSAGDYEDLAFYKGDIWVLRSNGSLIRVVRDSSGSRGIEMGKLPLSGDNDFETLYADTSRHALVMICKSCASDDNHSVSAYAYYPDSTGFSPHPVFTIDADRINAMADKKTGHFRPSAAAIHPVLRKLFILSATSSQLAVTDLNGQVESVYRLMPSLFPQPEGITFLKNGDMYISNESTSKPTILKFTYSNNESDKKDTAKSLYNYDHPDEKLELGKHLHEISGMSYIADQHLILAENDEKGDIFKVDFDHKVDEVGKVKFGGRGDYEDIVHTPDAVYMLISSGTVVKVNTKDSAMTTEDFVLPSDAKNEFETLYKDADGKSLILLCKECAHEKKTQVRSAYRFNTETNTYDPEPYYQIDINAVRAKLNDNSTEFEFKPSAAAISPVNGKLYIVASVGKLLVVADTKGHVEEVYRLNPEIYNQPEGMTFDPDGNLYISNEGGEGVGTILKLFKK